MLPGEYDGRTDHVPVDDVEPMVVFAGRHIPEKQVPTIPPALALARKSLPELRGAILGDGPDRGEVIRRVSELGLNGVIEVPGFVATAAVEERRRAFREHWAAIQSRPSLVATEPLFS